MISSLNKLLPTSTTSATTIIAASSTLIDNSQNIGTNANHNGSGARKRKHSALHEANLSSPKKAAAYLNNKGKSIKPSKKE